MVRLWVRMEKLKNSKRTFPQSYNELVIDILTSPYEEVNKRTGVKIKTLRGSVTLKIDLSSGELPRIHLRKTYPHIAAAEVAWFLSADRDITWLKKYAKIWDKFTEYDGTIKNAYGYRWRKHFRRDQIKLAVEALKKDQTDRQTVIMAWDPANDGLGTGIEKNVPCPVGFTLSVVDCELHSTLLMRSSDVFVGLPYDIMGQAILMQVLATSIGVNMGTMTFTLAHPHIYENHISIAQTCFDNYFDTCVEYQHLPFPTNVLPENWTVEEVEADKDGFVGFYKNYGPLYCAKDFKMFNPKVDIVL